MKVFVDAFTRTGFTGGINWYRNLTRNWEQTGTMEQRVHVPGLMIMAEDDVVLPPSHDRRHGALRARSGDAC